MPKFTRTMAVIFVVAAGLVVAGIAAAALLAPETLDPAAKKGLWDRIDVVFKVISAIGALAIPAAIWLATRTYDDRQREADSIRLAAENTRANTQLELAQLERAQQILPLLRSEDPDVVWPAISLVSRLGAAPVARQLSSWAMAQLVLKKDDATIRRLKASGDTVIAALARDAHTQKDSTPPGAAETPIEPDYRIRVGAPFGGKVRFDDPDERRGPFLVTRRSHHVAVPGEARMGQYPVTNESFLEFVDKGGYTTDSYWNGVPGRVRARFLTQDGRSRGPSTWPSGNSYLPGRGRHPVAGVSFYEALAYCRWLQQHEPPKGTVRRWCLPTEDMWELAARSEAGYAYPWGASFEVGACNSVEAGIGTTSDVNKYQRGISRYDCFDMAGNVWEFVRTDTGDNWSCVLRGGSFRNNRDEISSHFRLVGVPREHRPPDFGFRCAQAHAGILDRVRTILR